MINIKELRIGNLVLNGSAVCKVLALDGTNNSIDIVPVHDDRSSNEICMSVDGIFGLPITELWLKDQGFKQKITFPGWTKNGVNYWFYEEDQEMTIQSREQKTDINFVHQLQNLHFLMSGEELIYEPTI